jgi:hypothetical protein
MIHYAVFFKPDPNDQRFPIDEVVGGISLNDGKLTVYGSEAFVQNMSGKFASPVWERAKEAPNPLEVFFMGPLDHVRFLRKGSAGEKVKQFEDLMARVPNKTSKVVPKRSMRMDDIRSVRVAGNGQ